MSHEMLLAVIMSHAERKLQLVGKKSKFHTIHSCYDPIDFSFIIGDFLNLCPKGKYPFKCRIV